MNGGLQRIGSRQTAGRGSFATVRRWNWPRSLPYSPFLSFFLYLYLLLSLSSPSLYFLLLFPYVARFQGRIHQLLLSLSLETVLLPSPPFFPSYASFVTPPLPLALRPRAPSLWSMLFFPANERAQARGFARSLYPRSFGSIPAGNVNTLSTAAKVVASHRVVAHVISYNLYKSLGTLIEIIRILDSYRIFYLLFKNLKRVSEIETFESWNKSTEGKLFVIVLINWMARNEGIGFLSNLIAREVDLHRNEIFIKIRFWNGYSVATFYRFISRYFFPPSFVTRFIF